MIHRLYSSLILAGHFLAINGHHRSKIRPRFIPAPVKEYHTQAIAGHRSTLPLRSQFRSLNRRWCSGAHIGKEAIILDSNVGMLILLFLCLVRNVQGWSDKATPYEHQQGDRNTPYVCLEGGIVQGIQKPGIARNVLSACSRSTASRLATLPTSHASFVLGLSRRELRI